MKSSVGKALCLSAVAMFLIAGMTLGSTSLPYASGFEGAWTASDPWTAGGGVATDPTHVSGSQGVSITNDSLTLSMTPATYTNVWMQVWARPVVGASDPAVSSVSGAFYVRDDGALRVYTGGSWTTIGTGLPISGNQWLGFIVHADYVENSFDIYYTSGSYGTNMVKMNASPLAFAAAATQATSFGVESGDKAYVDAMGASKGFVPVSLTSASNVRAHEFAAAASSPNFLLPVYSTGYTVAGQNLLSTLLGNDLRTGMQTGDEIKMYGTINEYWTYQISGGAWAPVGGAPAPNAMAILPSTVIQLARGGSETFGFFPYDSALNVEGRRVTGAPAYTTTIDLYGTSGGHSGFTAVNWPTAAATVNALPFNNPDGNFVTGDRLFLENPSVPGAYTEHWFDAANNRWMYWAAVPGTALPGAAHMWIKRTTADVVEPVSVTF